MAPAGLPTGKQISAAPLEARLFLDVKIVFLDESMKNQWFSLCPAFAFCKDGSDYFQNLYIMERKPEVITYMSGFKNWQMWIEQLQYEKLP